MTRVDLLQGLCAITDTLERLARTSGDAELEAIITQLDAMIGACVTRGMEPLPDDETAPCAYDGRDVCRAGEDAP
jgi:hypothetical protein